MNNFPLLRISIYTTFEAEGFFLDFRSHCIRQTREKSRAFSQITLDDDYIIKDNKPDAIKVIHTDGVILFEETRLSNQALWVSGKLQFVVLYRSDNEHSRMETLTGTIPFQEKMVMEQATEMDPVRISGEMEDLTVGLINSRKLSVRAVANLKAVVEEQTEEQIAAGIDDGGNFQQKISEREFLSVVAAEKDVIRFHGEVKLPNAKPNIDKLLWSDVQLRNLESGIAGGRIHIQGEVYFAAVYLCEGNTQIQWIESTIPCEKEVEGAGADLENAQLLWLTMHPEIIDVEPGNDYDGESRVIGIDISFAVEYKVWTEQKLPVLLDAYAPDRKLNISRAKCASMCFQMKNEAKLRLGETVTLDANQEKILQVCSATGKITVDRTTVEENGVRFEGVVAVRILYLTSEDNFPIAYAESLLPFEQTVEVNGMQKDIWYDYATSLDQLQVNLLDSSEFEVKAALRIAVLAFAENCFDKIESMEEEPLDMEELAAQPGLVGYVVQEEEELWDIAKRYHTTMEEIAATNHLKAPNVRPGTKLVIVKKITL
jgi:hypothetical protein